MGIRFLYSDYDLKSDIYYEHRNRYDRDLEDRRSDSPWAHELGDDSI